MVLSDSLFLKIKKINGYITPIGRARLGIHEMIAPKSVVILYELNYNPAFECRDEEGGDTMVCGPTEKVVDLVDWSSATLEETMSVQMQVRFMFLRIVDTLRDVFGEKGFAALSRVELLCSPNVADWIDACQDALSRLAAVLCCMMGEKMESNFMKNWCVIPENVALTEWDRFGRVRECFRVIIRYERLLQLVRLNNMVKRLAPGAQGAHNDIVLKWFRTQTQSGVICTTHAIAWLRSVSDECKADARQPKKGEALGDTMRMLQCGLSDVVCRLPFFAGAMPETLMFDRARLQSDYVELQTIVAMLSMAEFAREWAVYALGTRKAVGFLNALDELSVDVTSEEYSSAIQDLRSRTLMDMLDRVDDSTYFFHDSGLRTLRSSYHTIVLDALLGAVQNFGSMQEETESIQDRKLTVAPVFLPRIQEWSYSVYRTTSSHLRIFMPVYEDLLLKLSVTDSLEMGGNRATQRRASRWWPAVRTFLTGLVTKSEKSKM